MNYSSHSYFSFLSNCKSGYVKVMLPLHRNIFPWVDIVTKFKYQDKVELQKCQVYFSNPKVLKFIINYNGFFSDIFNEVTNKQAHKFK